MRRRVDLRIDRSPNFEELFLVFSGRIGAEDRGLFHVRDELVRIDPPPIAVKCPEKRPTLAPAAARTKPETTIWPKGQADVEPLVLSKVEVEALAAGEIELAGPARPG